MKKMSVKNPTQAILIGLGLLIALGGVVSAETEIPTYTIVDLGTFGSPDSDTWSSGYALNEQGDVVGVAQDEDFFNHGFLYRDGELIDLGALTPGYPLAWSRALNDRGQVAGSSMAWSPYPKFPTWVQRPFVWSPEGGMSEFAMGIGIDGEIAGINDRGQMALSLTTVPDETAVTQAHFWDPDTGLRAIPFPGFDDDLTQSEAWAINQRGQVVGSFESEDLAPHAYVWNPHSNEAVDLHGPTAVASGAYAINDRGDVAGWFDAQGLRFAVIWNHDGRIVSPPAVLRPELPSGTAEGINNHGDVVGWYSTEQGTDPLAWVLFEAVDGEFPDGYPESIALVDLLEETDRAEWELWYAYGINDARQIVGVGLHNDRFRAYLMTPDIAPQCEFEGYPGYTNEVAARAVLELRGADAPMFASPEDYDRAARDLALIAADHAYLDPALGWRDDYAEHTRRFICGIDTGADRSKFDELAACHQAQITELFNGDMVFVDFPEPVNPDTMAALYAEDPSVRYCETTGNWRGNQVRRGHYVSRDYGNGWWLWEVRVTWGGAGGGRYDCDYVYRFFTHSDYDRVYTATGLHGNPDTSRSRLSAAECGTPDVRRQRY